MLLVTGAPTWYLGALYVCWISFAVFVGVASLLVSHIRWAARRQRRWRRGLRRPGGGGAGACAARAAQALRSRVPAERCRPLQGLLLLLRLLLLPPIRPHRRRQQALRAARTPAPSCLPPPPRRYVMAGVSYVTALQGRPGAARPKSRWAQLRAVFGQRHWAKWLLPSWGPAPGVHDGSADKVS